MNWRNLSLTVLLTAAAAPAAVSIAQAVTIDLVTVGNEKNDADKRYATPGYGSVDDVYKIGKFEITAGQYCEFLNAVAEEDPYGLYNAYMDYDAIPDYRGCNIKQIGPPGDYSYSVAADWANRPVNHVSWGDAARFCNWLHNGQGGGNTEDGAYELDGETSDVALMAVERKEGAKWWIPSEDEWYKAAYYDPNKLGGAGYWDYPTGTNDAPNNGNPGGDTGNTANFWDGDFTIDSPYWRTPVGYFGQSESPYGTFDQGGNVWEWNETAITDSERGARGACWNGPGDSMQASFWSYGIPTASSRSLGFRVATVPEPATLVMLVSALACFSGLAWRRMTPADVRAGVRPDRLQRGGGSGTDDVDTAH